MTDRATATTTTTTTTTTTVLVHFLITQSHAFARYLPYPRTLGHHQNTQLRVVEPEELALQVKPDIQSPIDNGHDRSDVNEKKPGGKEVLIRTIGNDKYI